MSNLIQNLVVGPMLRSARRPSANPRSAGPTVEAVAVDVRGQAGAEPHVRTESHVNPPTPPAQHATLISDVATTLESAGEERGGVDVLNELHRNNDATGVFPAHARLRRPPSSTRSRGSVTSVAEDRMSINPAHEASESLRSRSSVSVASNAHTSTSSPSRPRADTEQDMEPRGADDGPGVQQAPGVVRTMDGSLPDDDGMRGLRRKLQEIKTLAVSTEEKALRMHYLMTQDYLAHRADSGALEGVDGDVLPPLSSLAPPIDPANPYKLLLSDLEPSFSPLPVVARDAHGDHTEAVDEGLPALLGCEHYKRNVKVQCFDCHRWFACRHCHDQSPDLPFPHQLNRQKTLNMLCMLCQTPQPAGEMCSNCGEYAAWYYCSRCKLWDNDSNKRIYHCDDCGICRVGEGLGKDFVHCRRCNVCISISTSASHPCIERATEGDCPLCLVRLFESSTPVVSLPCGHYMHGECYRDLMCVTYKCPVCSKSAVNMELQWRKLDDEVRLQPMPDDGDDLDGLLPHANGAATPDEDNLDTAEVTRRPRTVYVGCNDCSRRSWTPFHWLGLKCQVCDSYNTNQMAPTAMRETEAERLLRQQQQAQHHRQHDFTGNAVLRDAGIGADDDLVADNTLEIPTSPSQQPIVPDAEREASSAPHSPGRRYFVQNEEERRPSVAASRFSTSNIPTLPNLPEMPHMPRMPQLPNLPNMRHLPNMPNMPNLELSRFSAYQMFDAMSRSLSPMRYYLQGFDVRDGHLATGAQRNHSPTSIRSDPTGEATAAKRRASEASEDIGFWASDGQFDDGTDDSIHAVRRNDDETSSSSESEMSDLEMAEEDDEGGDDEGLELPGHR
ncbi:hypothetical protein LTR36_005242 [Oleoguttula mirabilis]|uniref:Zf-CHY-domain-containing protein n=1 Tax=Oleoguttula mirabilis TaxID=1507867 RepID=A0AAV9JX80_9PEZI|nr:hypothetical protein LTR36_005242 [Oleoguttula mirabilis]